MRCLSTPVYVAIMFGAAIGARHLQVTQPTAPTLTSPARVINEPRREDLFASNAHDVSETAALPVPSLPPVKAPAEHKPIGHADEFYEWEIIEPGRVETRVRPAVYKTLVTPVVERPAYVRRFYYYDCAGDLRFARKFVPAEVRYVRRNVLVQPEWQETIVIPPKQRLVKRRR